MSYQSAKWRATHIALSMLLLLIISGCSTPKSYWVEFDLTGSNFKTKGKSIAVISGTKEPLNVALAKQVSESLAKNSSYQISTQAQISKAVDSYPQTIKGPYKSAYFHIDIDWEMSDRKKIADLQRSLGVDYLYIIWAPMAVQTNGSETSSLTAVAQLFEQPNSKEVAQSSMGVWVDEKAKFRYFKEGADGIALELAKETKMAIAAKK